MFVVLPNYLHYTSGAGSSSSTVSATGTFVHLTGNETISGKKLFYDFPTFSGGFYLGSGENQFKIIREPGGRLQILTTGDVLGAQWNPASSTWDIVGQSNLGDNTVQLSSVAANFTAPSTFNNTVYASQIVDNATNNAQLDVDGNAIIDYNAKTSINWINRYLIDALGTSVTLDWNNRFLSGTWNVLGGIRTSGAALITGMNTGNFISTTQTGQFYPYSNPSNFANSGNLYTTGSNLYNLINNFSGVFNNSGVVLESQIMALSGHSRVSAINVTGFGNQTGVINFSGLGSLTVLTGAGNFIYFSGSSAAVGNNGDGLNLSGNLYSTGSNLYNLINNFSGVFNNSGFVLESQIIALSGHSRVSAINVTGFGNQTGVINFSGIGSVTVMTGSNNFIYFSGSNVASSSSNSDGLNLSGNLYSTGSSLYNLINNFSGVFNNSGFVLESQIVALSGVFGNNIVFTTGIQKISGQKVVTPTDAATVPLIISGMTGQSADLTSWSVYDNGTIAKMSNNGKFSVGYTGDISSRYADFYVAPDTNNGSISALYIAPPSNSYRMFLGDVSKNLYALNLSNSINGIEGLSTLSLSKNLAFAGTNDISGNAGGGMLLQSYWTIAIGGNQQTASLFRNITEYDTSNRSSLQIFNRHATNSSLNVYGYTGGKSAGGDILQIREGLNKSLLTTFNKSGFLGINTSTPTAYLHLAGGVNVANSGAPVKFTAGTLLTSPENGALEYSTTGLHLTDNLGRRGIIITGDNQSGIITTGIYFQPTQLVTGFGNTTINWSSGNVFKYTLTGNTTFSFSNNRDGQTIVVGVGNTGALIYTCTWPSTVLWPAGTAPTLTAGAKMDIFTFINIYTGIYGNAVQNFVN